MSTEERAHPDGRNDHPPAGLHVTDTIDHRTVHLEAFVDWQPKPWMYGAAAAAILAVAVGCNLLPFACIALVLLALIRQQFESEMNGASSPRHLQVRLDRDELRLTWRGRHDRPDRVFLRDLREVELHEVANGRWHLVVQVAGREETAWIPMEHESHEAVRWLADTLEAARDAARERDGRGRHEIPDALARLREHER